MKALFAWLKSVYSEPSGNGSSTRILLGMIVAFILGIGVSFAISTNHGKFSMDQFCHYLETSGNFILTTGGPLYGINKAADAYKNKGNGNDNGQNGA